MILGVDVGGTFTDAALLTDDRLVTGKAPTTPDDQSEGVIEAVEEALANAGAGADAIERQDENEPSGRYELEVVEAEFPRQQKLAKRSDLVVRVRNADSKTVPNVGVTVEGFSRRLDDPDLADPNRPVFVINGQPKEIGGFPESKEAAPEGGETAYVNTWALGKLRPGAEKTFRWSVTAVKAGPYRLRYTVNAGLDGKAKAVDSGRRVGPPRGRFVGVISDEPPEARVAEDGQTVIEGTR